MKVKVYNVKNYIENLIPNSRPVSHESIAIIKCRKGIVILDNESIGGSTSEGMEFELQIPIIKDDKFCMNVSELPTIKLTLQNIVDNCECEEKPFEEFIINKHKTRIQCNMMEAKQIIRKLNSKKDD